MFKSIIVLVLVFCSTLVFSQPDLAEKTVKNGKVCFVHVVQTGNTLYGIQRMYDVPVKEIIAFNKGSEDGLKVGQVIYIPTNLSVNETETKDYTIHTVEPKQTLYGISRIYSCSVDEIIKLNPGAEKGIKVGDKIKIPRKVDAVVIEKNPEVEPLENPFKVEFEDSIALHTVQAGQTLYSISKQYMIDVDEIVKINTIKRGKIKEGQVLQIPLKKEVVQTIEVKPIPVPATLDTVVGDSVVFPLKKKYKVAIILPFLTDKNKTAISGVVNSNTKLNGLSEIAIDFYAGAKLALDSLEQLGLIAEVNVYDSKRDSSTVSSILKKSEFKNTDIIIGPLFKKSINAAAAWCKANEARLIVPVPIETAVLKNNPYVSCAVPSDLTQIKSLAFYLSTIHGDDNVVLVKTGSSKDDVSYQVFRDEFNKNTTNDSYRGVLKEVNLGSSSGSDLSHAVVKDTLTIFVDLSKDVSHVMKFMTALNKVKNKSGGFSKTKIIAVGLKDWMSIKELNSYYKNRFTLHHASPNDLNYEKENVKEFVLKLREEFEIDASKYAIQGFDVTYGYLANYCLGINVEEGLMNNFKLTSIGEGNGSENSTCFILKQQDFRIQRVGVVYGKGANK